MSPLQLILKSTMYFKVRTKSKENHSRQIRGIMLLVLSFVLAYCLIVPDKAGAFGRAVGSVFFISFGKITFVVPALFLWWGWIFIKPSYQMHWRLDTLWAVLLILAGASLLSSVSFITGSANFGGWEKIGGWAGLKISPFFRRLFGKELSIFVTAVLFVYLASFVLRVSIRKLLIAGWQKIADDYDQWQKAREELRKYKSAKVKEIRDTTPETGIPAIPKFKEKSEPKIIPPVKEQIPKQTQISKLSNQKVSDSAVIAKVREYKLPPIDFLSYDKENGIKIGNDEHIRNAELLTKTLADFSIESTVKEIIPGPVVTRYDIELAPGIKIQSVAALSENIALAMKSPSIRVVPVPEKSAVGIEVPNSQSCTVGLKSILSNPLFQNSKSILTLALGKTTNGSPYIADLMPMPHLLIAGATGSGKSVCLHSLILSILYKAKPDEVKFMLIDPKRLEMPVYRGLPHIYDPGAPPENADIITQPKDAAVSLRKLVRVMEKRYEKFAKETVRNIEGYNEKMAKTGGQKEFYIVVVIDELADLMLIATNEVEDYIQRLAQMARAVGIHLILATQRPSVDVITGVIKANFPSRIAFQTTSKVDSRVILDLGGADALLGKGDMLFLPPGESRPIRLQGAFVSSREAEQIVSFIRNQNIQPQYEYVSANSSAESIHGDENENNNELIKALHLVVERKRVSQDLLKAHFGSSARATNLLSLLETKGFIHKPEGTNRWSIHFEKINEYLNSGSITDR